ncbi:dTDP-4-dehydrorhamnose 3,5-epimerase [Sporocytophaga myxococcoides]|uniref:dTDP-4-dehydrorhamnose 3,5-epimerase n=1 Tax=Sporocytophaga myxococcoides TaxID=153721 RepID=UPI00048B73B7|nr:dTDP-4-dehydrorhamnose 3,5-epimerase [Sporocytophaga myxococcoides]
MHFRESYIKDLFEITPRLFKDDRGFFFESYNTKVFKDNGLDLTFVQDNQSYSIPGVVRGLHFQNAPHAQGKLVRVIKGKILDVAVDIRKDSPTFGKYDTFLLDSEKCNMVYIPEGFAHGFSALEESIVFYKCTDLYHKESESGIIWNDPSLNIDWMVKNPLVSDKDQLLKPLKELFSLSSL